MHRKWSGIREELGLLQIFNNSLRNKYSSGFIFCFYLFFEYIGALLIVKKE